MTEKPVYADFGNTDVAGNIRLNLRGTIEALREAGVELHDGLELTLSDGELIARGVVHYSNEEEIWVARVSWPQVTDISE